MTDRRFRHMPVEIDGVLSGIVTIGDVVKGRLDELETEHDQLMGYISQADSLASCSDTCVCRSTCILGR